MHPLSDCSPPAVKVTAQAVAAPVVSVQGECTSKPSVRLDVSYPGDGVARRLFGSRSLDGIFPAVDQPRFLDSVADCRLDHDVQDPHRQHIGNGEYRHLKDHLTLGLNLQLLDERLGHGLPPTKKSNLDATRRRVVRKGARVSMDARHWYVVKVRLGIIYLKPINAFGTVQHFEPGCIRFCSDVQVIA